MNNKSRINIFIFSAFYILLLYPSSLFSQQTDKDVSEIMALKLKQKVILSDEQTAKVKVILSNYIIDIASGDKSAFKLKKAEDDIAALLNEKQEAKFNIIRTDFFEEVNQRVIKKF